MALLCMSSRCEHRSWCARLLQALAPLRQIRLHFALQQKAIVNGYNAAGHIVNCNNVSSIGNIIEHDTKKSVDKPQQHITTLLLGHTSETNA